MNQRIKKLIYELGNDDQIALMKELGGMNPTEAKLLDMWHSGQTDLFAQMELGVSQSAFTELEEQVRNKTRNAVFSCIDHRLQGRN